MQIDDGCPDDFEFFSGDDEGLMEAYRDIPTDDLPANSEDLFVLVRELTVHILEMEWGMAVYEQCAGGELFRATLRRARAHSALGKKGNEAIAAGRRQYADELDDVARQVFLHGTALQRQILVTECKLEYLKSLEESTERRSK